MNKEELRKKKVSLIKSETIQRTRLDRTDKRDKRRIKNIKKTISDLKNDADKNLDYLLEDN